jgi:putative DNA primase/helicase
MTGAAPDLNGGTPNTISNLKATNATAAITGSLVEALNGLGTGEAQSPTATPLEPNPFDAAAFLRLILPSGEGLSYRCWEAPVDEWASRKKGKVVFYEDRTLNEPCRTVEDIITTLKRDDVYAKFVYFALGGWETFDRGRKAENVKFLRCLFMDVDVGHGGEENSYETEIEARADLVRFCRVAKLPIPMIVRSGSAGLHTYWPVTADVPTSEWLRYAKALKDACDVYGFKADPSITANAAAVLRLPGTFNRKGEILNGSPPVEVICEGLVSAFELSQFDVLFNLPPPETKKKDEAPGPGEGDWTQEKEDKLRAALTFLGNTDQTGYDEWFETVAGICHTGWGDKARDIAYKWSSLSTKHNDEKFNKTWASCGNYSGKKKTVRSIYRNALNNGWTWLDDHRAKKKAKADKGPPKWSPVECAKLQRAVEYIDITKIDHDTWVRIGLALHWTAWGEAAQQIFEEFSKRDVRYGVPKAVMKWEEFDQQGPSKTGKIVTLGTLYHIAAEHGWKPGQESPQGMVPEFSEEGLALVFSERHADDLRYVARWGKWFIWVGTHWREDDTLKVQEFVREICREAAGGNAPDAVSKAATVSAIERLARSDRRHATTVDQWDADIWLLNTPGGTVDLRTGAIRPARPMDYCTKITAVTPGGECPIFLAFISRIMNKEEEMVSFIQRYSGYCVTGNTREESLAFNYGTGQNGKSTLMEATGDILGDYHMSAPMEMLTVTNNPRHETELARLKGARLVSATETEQGRRWAEAKIKYLTGGEPITARFMHQNHFEYRAQFKLWVSGNHRPSLRNVDKAMRRRMKMIPFTITIPDEEKDLELKQKLKSEYGGILQWMIDGCLEWQKIGLSVPARVSEATNQYLTSEDTIQNWIDECCEVGPNNDENRTRLFEAFRQWAEETNEWVPSSKNFYTRLVENYGCEEFKNRGDRRFRGISLTDEAKKSLRYSSLSKEMEETGQADFNKGRPQRSDTEKAKAAPIRIIGQGGRCETCFSQEDVFVYAPGNGAKSKTLCEEHAREWAIDLGRTLGTLI